tara:strand:+ start:1667 stop:3145 length:1479 start_codon:yes stop_codon:yes gene_type:complete
MTNLSDLFPAGAGKQVSFVASGNLSNGQTVFLKSDGTVEGVQNSAGTITKDGTNAGMSLSVTTDMKTDWDSNSNVLVVFSLNSSNYPTITAASVSGTTLTFGTTVVLSSNAVTDVDATMGLKHHPTSAYGLAVWGYAGNNIYVGGYSISGTSVTLEGVATASNSTSGIGGAAIGYQTSDSQFLIQGYNSSNSSIEVFACSYSGGTPSLVSELSTGYSFGFSSSSGNCDFAYDSTQEKMLWVCRTNSTPYVRYAVMDYNGGSFQIYNGTVDTATQWSDDVSVEYDAEADRGIIAYNYDNNNNLKVVTLDVGASSATLGTATTVVSGSSYGSTQFDLSYDTLNQRTVLAYQKNDTPDINALVVSVDSGGSTITLGTNTVLQTYNCQALSTAYDPQNNEVLVTYAYNSKVQTDFLSVAGTNNLANFIGITDAAISNTASGNVTIKGGISTNVSSLTIGSDYYVQADGSISTTSTSPAVKIGKALSATALNLEYTS